MNNKKQLLSISLILAATVFGSSVAFAHDRDRDDDDDQNISSYLDSCDTLPLVNTLVGGPVNTSVCVDAPVALQKAKVLFNLDQPVTNGAGFPTGLRHMWMLGTALQARIQAGLLDPEDVSIIGVFHGAGSAWAHKDTPMAAWIEKIFTLKDAGVNISLEMCGVTMLGKGWSNVDLYTSNNYSGDNGFIHVNQGAIGRIIDLEQHGYAYIDEN